MGGGGKGKDRSIPRDPEYQHKRSDWYDWGSKKSSWSDWDRHSSRGSGEWDWDHHYYHYGWDSSDDERDYTFEK